MSFFLSEWDLAWFAEFHCQSAQMSCVLAYDHHRSFPVNLKCELVRLHWCMATLPIDFGLFFEGLSERLLRTNWTSSGPKKCYQLHIGDKGNTGCQRLSISFNVELQNFTAHYTNRGWRHCTQGLTFSRCIGIMISLSLCVIIAYSSQIKITIRRKQSGLVLF